MTSKCWRVTDVGSVFVRVGVRQTGSHSFVVVGLVRINLVCYGM